MAVREGGGNSLNREATPIYEPAVVLNDTTRFAEAGGDKFGEFRDFTTQKVKHFDKIGAFYAELHAKQTVEHVKESRKRYATLDRQQMTIWEAFDMLNEIVDDSDPDTDSTQDIHAYQTGEAARTLYPGEENDWFHLTAFIHDLGKILCHSQFGEPQWNVVGDKYPVGCQYSSENLYPDTYAGCPDYYVPEYQSQYGIYQPNCGLDNVLMSYGHDEYLYQVLRGNENSLPYEAYFVIRYHSFYTWHTHSAYKHLANEHDMEMRKWSQAFQKCDLYSKSDDACHRPNKAEARPYYASLITKYFGSESRKLNW